MFYLSKKAKLFVSSFICFAFIPLCHAQSQEDDPCNNLTGNWKGTIYTMFYTEGDCLLDADIKFSKYKNTIRMEGTGLNPRGDTFRCTAGAIAEAGTCKDAMMSLNTRVGPRNGTIFGNSIDLMLAVGGGYQKIHLEKQ